MNDVYLLLGSNLGNRASQLSLAVENIENFVEKIAAISDLYESAAWGVEDQQDFYNLVIRVSTLMPASELLLSTQGVEKKMGKVKLGRWMQRSIDIDILYYNGEIVNRPELIIPHPHIQKRKFTLLPMAELAPGFVHPVLGKTQQELLENCEDPLWVRPIGSLQSKVSQ